MSFLAPEGELSSGFVRLDFLRKVSRKNWPSVFSARKPLAGLHLPQPWERKPDHSKRGRHLMVILLPLAKHKTPPPLPPSPFVPPQTLPRFWREGEVILCMCEPAF